MVKVIVKCVNEKDMDGKLTFHNYDGLEFGAYLPSFPEGLMVDYDGNITFINDENDLKLRANELQVNITEKFHEYHELYIEYNKDYIIIKIFNKKEDES